jgi:hypothetical protein
MATTSVETAVRTSAVISMVGRKSGGRNILMTPILAAVSHEKDTKAGVTQGHLQRHGERSICAVPHCSGFDTGELGPSRRI